MDSGSAWQADNATARQAGGAIDWNGSLGLAPRQPKGQLMLQRLPLHLPARYAADRLAGNLLRAETQLQDATGAAQPVHPLSRAARFRPLESWCNAPIIIVSTQHQRVLAADPAPTATRFASMRWDADMVLAALADVKSL